MNSGSARLLMVAVLSLAINGCTSSTSPTPAASAPSPVPPSLAPEPTPTPVPPTLTPEPEGKTIVVDSSADSGSGTLRQALEDAQPYDTINFDPAVFPPDAPQTIAIASELPHIHQGHLTIDASDAGVILDGSLFPANSFVSGLEIASEGNTVRGLQIYNFTGAGIAISSPESRNNTIGGASDIGDGPIGQRNLTSSNGLGIGLWGSASDNTILGNLVGTDPSGDQALGNRGHGVEVTERAMRNVVGPNNLIVNNGDFGVVLVQGANDNVVGPNNEIAYNRRSGVWTNRSDSTGNTITQNSIYDNGELAIFYGDTGIFVTDVPIVLEFDLQAGTIAGLACAGCTVEVFSDMDDEGGVYEGRTVANGSGGFTFDKGGAFIGPNLTAAMTNADGTTSQLSIPTSGVLKTSVWQEHNESPRSLLVTQTSDALEDNRIGGIWSNFWQFDMQATIDQEIVPNGLKFAKISISQPEPLTGTGAGDIGIDWSKPELSIPPAFDSQMTSLSSHDVTIHYMLNFWDKANHPNGWEVRSRFKTEVEISRYIEYVQFVVSSFKGRVQYYELWNEPDVGAPLHYIEPNDFLNLARRTIPIIKQIDPEALVVIPSVSGTAHPQAREYLFRILNSDVMQLADVISWHPFFNVAPDSVQFPEYYANYPTLLAEIISAAQDNGFQGEFAVGEITFWGPGCDGCGAGEPPFSDIISTKYTARIAILHLGNNVIAGLGGISSARPIHTVALRNMTNIFAGASAETFEVEAHTDAENVKVLTFARTDGSKLVAIWTDGVAVEHDPGVTSRVAIPGFAEWSATGIDILNSFEQSLITRTEEGALVIEGALIRDYPFIIRLTNPGSS